MDLGIPIENFMKEVVPDTYLFHKSGCYHYFSTCSPQKEILSIYRQPIWPGVERINFFRIKKPRFLIGSIGKGRQFYPTIGLSLNKKTFMKYDKRVKKFYKVDCKMRTNLHKIVATICIFKPSAEHRYVDHINGDRADYRIENLRWTTPRENAIGTPGGKRNPDEIYDLTRAYTHIGIDISLKK